MEITSKFAAHRNALSRAIRHAGVQSSLDALRKGGITEEDIFAELIGHAEWLKKARGGVDQGERDRERAPINARTLLAKRRNFLRFAGRIRNFAMEISRYNSTPDTAPLGAIAECVYFADNKFYKEAKAFAKLPDLLQAYSRYVETMHQALRHQDHSKHLDASTAEVLVVHEIKVATGRPNYRQVADLLNATYDCFKVHRSTDATTLKMNYRRHVLKGNFLLKYPARAVRDGHVCSLPFGLGGLRRYLPAAKL